MSTQEERFDWAVKACIQAKMRLTPIREKILTFLAAQHVPISLEAVMEAESLRGVCDAATAYRTLMLLRELEIIRQVSLPNKVSYYILNIPGESSHFLICRCCGSIDALPASESVSAVERETATKQGYSRLSHELVVFGLCPECQKHPPGILCAKVQPRMRSTSKFKPGFSKTRPEGSGLII